MNMHPLNDTGIFVGTATVPLLPARLDTFETCVGPAAFKVRSEFPEIVAWLKRDYLKVVDSFGLPTLRVNVICRSPSPVSGGLRSPRSAWHPRGNRTEVIFFGAVAVHYDPLNHFAIVAGEDRTLVYEALEFLLAAYLGERADAKGWHRVHGLGVAFHGSGVLFLGKAGAGKTTLGADLFYHPAANYFSDDVPWISADGWLRAYPHRFSFKTFPEFPVDRVRPHRRPIYGERFFVDAPFFEGRWSAARPLEKIYLLRRGQVRGCFLQSRWRVFGWLLRWLVLGLETPQIFELRVRPGGKSVWAGVRAVVSRLRTAVFLARTVEGYALTYLSGDRPARVLED